MKAIDDAPNDSFELSTGKRLKSVLHSIGLRAGGEPTTGYDDSLDIDDLTHAERSELADYMIDLWQKWKGEQ